MTGAYAMTPPWPWFAGRCCGPQRGRESWNPENWWAEMTGRRAHYGPRAMGPWAPFGGPPPFGPPPFGSPGGRGWRSAKARKGDVRAAILSVLSDASLNGYQIIQEIVERSGGNWKPSPGSIYPTLQQLEDEGLVWAESAAGKRTYSLTDDGRSYVSEHADEVAAPWQAKENDDHADDGLKPLIGQIAAAIWQIAAVGTPEQQAKGKEALAELRRKLYAILAETDEPAEDRR